MMLSSKRYDRRCPMAIPQVFLDDPFLSARDIMEITGLKRATVYVVMKREMKIYRFGKRIFVRLSDFQKWLDEKKSDPFYD